LKQRPKILVSKSETFNLLLSLPLIDCIPWDVRAFCKSPTKSSKKFPNPNFGLIDKPAIVVDINGIVVLWYLPGLLLPPRQVSVQF
jgi:hypothetical protein